MNRRNMIKGMAGTLAVSTLGITQANALVANSIEPFILKGNIKHSVSQWCYGSIPLEEFAKRCVEIGIQSIELLGEKDWAIVNKYGLKCAIGYATDYGIPKGFNRLENHDKLITDFTDRIPKAAAAGVPNLICFSGNREGITTTMD